MSTTIDSKVVEMKFDNSKFESNVKQTMSTLDKLKASLAKISGKHATLDVDTSSTNKGILSIGNAVDSVSSKFTALEAVAFGALAKIGQQALVAGENLIKSLSTDNIMAGWSKYDEKTSSVQTLVNSTGKSVEEINKYLDQLMWYSDETSYSFTEMTSALAQMTSTGGDIDKLIPTITGIANATAYAGKTGEAFNHTIRNITQSYNAGYLQLMDWKSLNLAGTSSKQLTEQLIKAAEELGTVQKGFLTIENFAEHLKDKNITSDVMDLAFSRFSAMSQEAYKLVQSGEFDTASEAIEAIADDFDNLASRAFKSAQEAKTFAEALDATKDAVSSGWMQTFEIIFGNYEEAKVLWTDIANRMWDFFAGGAEGRNQQLAKVMGNNWDAITEKINECGIETEEFEKQLELTVAAGGLNVDSIKTKYGNLATWLEKSDGMYNHYVKDTIAKMAYSTTELSDDLKVTTKNVEDFHKVIDKMASGKIKNAATAIKELEKANFKGAEAQEMVNKFYESGGKKVLDLQVDARKLEQTMLDLNEAQISALGYSDEEVKKLQALSVESRMADSELGKLIDTINTPSGRQMLLNSLFNVLDSFESIVAVVKDAFAQIFPPASAATIKGIIGLIETLTAKMKDFFTAEENVDKLTRTFKGLFAILDIIKTIALIPINVAIGVFNALMGDTELHILDVTASIGDWLVALRDWIKEHDKTREIIAWLVPKIQNVVSVIKDLTKEGGALNIVFKAMSGFLENIKNAFGEWLQGLIEAEDKPRYIIDSLIYAFREGIPNFIAAGADAISSLLDAIWGGLNNSEMKGVGSELLSAFKEGFDKTLGVLLDKIFDFGKNVMNKLKTLPWDKIFAIGMAFGLIKTLKNVAGMFKSLTDSLGDFLDNVGGGIADLGKAAKREALGDMALKFAEAVAILTGCIVALALVPAEKAKTSVTLIAILIGVFTAALKILNGSMKTMTAADAPGYVAQILAYIGLITAIGAFITALSLVIVMLSKAGDLTQGLTIVTALFGMVVAILLLLAAIAPRLEQGSWAIAALGGFFTSLGKFFVLAAVAMRIVGSMDEDAFRQGGIFLAAMMTFIAALAIIVVLVKDMPAEMVIFGKAMESIAKAMLITAIAVKLIGSLEWTELAKGGLFLAAMLTFIGLIMVFTKNIHYKKALVEFGKMMLSIGATMLLAAIAVKMIGGMEWSELAKGGAFLAAMLIFTGLMAKVTKAGGKEVKGFAKLMASLGASMILMAVAVKILGGMDVDDLKRGELAILGLAIIMGLLVQSFRGFKKEAPKIATAILALAACIAVMALVCAILGQLKPEALAKGLIAVTVFGVLLIVLVRSMKALKGVNDMMKNFIGLAIIITAITACLLLLTIVPAEEALTAAASIALVMLALSVVMKNIGKIKLNKTAREAIAFMALLMLEISGVLVLMSQFGDAQALIPSAIALSVVLLAVVAAMRVLNGVKDINKGMIANVALMGLVAAEIGIVLGILNALGLEGSIETAIAIGVLIDLLAVALLPLTLVGTFAAEALAGIGLLEVLILATAAVVTLIGSLFEQFDSDLSSLDKGIAALGKVGEAIGAFFGGIFAGIADKMLDLLPKAGQALSDFYVRAIPFIVGMATLPDGIAEGALSLSAALLAILAAEVLNAIMSFFGISMDANSLGSRLADIGTAVVMFSDSIKSLTTADINRVNLAADAAVGLSRFVNGLPAEGGWKQKILGTVDFGAFTQNLQAFGPALKGFADEVKDLDTEAISNAATAAQGLSDFANSLPPSDAESIKGWFLGRNTTIQEFGQQLQSFGLSLVGFSNSVKSEGSIDNDAIGKAVDAAQLLSDLADKLPPTDGILQEWFIGSNHMNMETFGNQLTALGNGLADFSIAGNGIIAESMKRAVTAVGDLADIAVKLKGAEESFDVFKSDAMADLSEDLPGLGQALVSFNNSISTLSAGSNSMGYALDNLQKVVDSVVAMQGVDYEYIYSFKDALNSLAEFDMQGLVNTFTVEGIEQVGTAGKKISDSIVEGLKKGDDSIKKTASMLMTSILNEIHVMYHYFHDTGYEITEQMRSGIRMGEAGLVYETKGVVNSAQRSINDYYPHFVAVGAHLMNGLHDGLASQEDTVVGKAQEIAAKILAIMEKTSEIQSPSKATFRMGRYLDEGLINGMKKYSRQVYSTAEILSTKTLDGFSKSIDQIYEVIDADLNPVITPTINLDYVKQGVSDINSMFNAKSLNANAELQNGADVNGAGGPTISFTQINNSPKALSRIDIYRQTRNQIAQMKGALN